MCKKKILLFIIGGIILVNLIAFGVSYTGASLILKIEPLNKAFVFAHGGYYNNQIGYNVHMTNLNGKSHVTNNIFNNLRYEGYEYIWISMCEQGNSDYVSEYPNGTKIEWGKDISRVDKSGNVYPLFVGLGIIRLNLGEET